MNQGQTRCVCRAASDDEPSALNPADVRLLVHRRSVSRAGLEQEEDGEADDEPRHDQRQRRRRRRHAEVLRHQVRRTLVASSSIGTCAGTTHWSCESKLASDLEEAFAGGHLDGDRRGEADHGGAAQPHVGAAAALLRALLAPDGQRPAGPGEDAPLAGGDAQ